MGQGYRRCGHKVRINSCVALERSAYTWRTFYKWKAKFGGRDVSDAKRLKALEEEDAKLKKLLAETMLDIAILKDINSRKW